MNKPSYEYLLLTNGELEKENLALSKLVGELLTENATLYTANNTQKDKIKKLRVN